MNLNRESIRPIFLLTWGRCGSRFLHGLLEGHPSLLTFPQSFNPYNCFHLSKKWSASAEVWAQHVLNDFSNIFWAYRRHVTKGFGDFSQFCGDAQIFVQALAQRLGPSINARDFFWAFHQAFFESLGESAPARPTHILSHVHNQKYMASLLEDFPQAQWIVIVRDPRSMLESHFQEQLLKAHAHALPIHEVWNRGLEKSLDSLLEFERLRRWVGTEKFRYIRIEDLHSKKEEVVRELAQWLGLSFHPTLMNCTLGGSPYSFSPRKGSVIEGQKISTAKSIKHFGPTERGHLESLFAPFLKLMSYPLPTATIFDHKSFLNTPLAGEKAKAIRYIFVARPWVEDLGSTLSGPIRSPLGRDPIRYAAIKKSFKKICKELWGLRARRHNCETKIRIAEKQIQLAQVMS